MGPAKCRGAASRGYARSRSAHEGRPTHPPVGRAREHGNSREAGLPVVSCPAGRRRIRVDRSVPELRPPYHRAHPRTERPRHRSCYRTVLDPRAGVRSDRRPPFPGAVRGVRDRETDPLSSIPDAASSQGRERVLRARRAAKPSDSPLHRRRAWRRPRGPRPRPLHNLPRPRHPLERILLPTAPRRRNRPLSCPRRGSRSRPRPPSHALDDRPRRKHPGHVSTFPTRTSRPPLPGVSARTPSPKKHGRHPRARASCSTPSRFARLPRGPAAR